MPLAGQGHPRAIDLAEIIKKRGAAAGAAKAALDRDDYRQALLILEPQTPLGMLYMHGQGAAQNDAEAVKWSRRAANQRDTQSQVLLGSAYFAATGVPQNFLMAHMWDALAAAELPEDVELHKSAVEARDALLLRMTPEQVAEGQRPARDWKPIPEIVPCAGSPLWLLSRMSPSRHRQRRASVRRGIIVRAAGPTHSSASAWVALVASGHISADGTARANAFAPSDENFHRSKSVWHIWRAPAPP